jgi:hypothetical protein
MPAETVNVRYMVDDVDAAVNGPRILQFARRL